MYSNIQNHILKHTQSHRYRYLRTISMDLVEQELRNYSFYSVDFTVLPIEYVIGRKCLVDITEYDITDEREPWLLRRLD